MNILYRLHTEDRPNLPDIANHYFPGFTILRGTGYYNRTPEPAAVIEIYGHAGEREEVEKLARAIATVNNQTSVIVAEFGSNGIGITEHGPVEVGGGEVVEFPLRRAA